MNDNQTFFDQRKLIIFLLVFGYSNHSYCFKIRTTI